MVLNASTGISTTELKALLLQEERKSERYANYVRLLFTILYFSVAISIRDELPVHSFNTIISVSLINLAYGLFIFSKLRNANPPGWVKYPSIGIDILLLSFVIFSFGTFRSFKTEAFLLYYLWIGATTLRFSPRLTLASGLLSVGSYLIIVVLALKGSTIELGTITDEFVSHRVSGFNILLRLVFLSAFVGLCVYIAYVFRVIAAKAITKQLLQVRNHEMSAALDQLRETQKQLARKNRELATLSEIDMLSQLYNRRKIDQIMNEGLQEANRRSAPLALILLDIDLFKGYNDRYGHQTGDQVIRKVAEILSNSARGNDHIGRWGGEEFIIVCRDTGAEDATQIAERLRKTIEATTFEVVERVTCSFGVTERQDGDSGDTLLKRADEALYLSKEEGRNRVTRR